MEFQFNQRDTGTQFHEWVAGEASAVILRVSVFERLLVTCLFQSRWRKRQG